MAVTMDQVRAALDPEEPDYAQAASELGADALPHLERLIVGDHPMLASKATYLAGLIGTERSVQAVERAARSGDTLVRVAAAAAARNLPQESASDILLPLVDDPDIGVQKVALNSVPAAPTADLRSRVEALGASRSDTAVRAVSREVLRRLEP
jgi:HEAT repeat protein